jgi:hypothetical protein
MDLQLAGKRALVTGSSSGIGSEIARMLAAEGIDVVVHGRNVERTQAVVRQIEDAGGRAAIALGDLMTEDGKAAVIDATGRAFGGVDILVNNAGGSSSDAARAWFETTGEEWTDSYRQNTLPSVALAQAFVPGMRERGWGRCIQISSRNAISASCRIRPLWCGEGGAQQSDAQPFESAGRNGRNFERYHAWFHLHAAGRRLVQDARQATRQLRSGGRPRLCHQECPAPDGRQDRRSQRHRLRRLHDRQPPQRFHDWHDVPRRRRRNADHLTVMASPRSARLHCHTGGRRQFRVNRVTLAVGPAPSGLARSTDILCVRQHVSSVPTRDIAVMSEICLSNRVDWLLHRAIAARNCHRGLKKCTLA